MYSLMVSKVSSSILVSKVSPSVYLKKTVSPIGYDDSMKFRSQLTLCHTSSSTYTQQRRGCVSLTCAMGLDMFTLVTARNAPSRGALSVIEDLGISAPIVL